MRNLAVVVAAALLSGCMVLPKNNRDLLSRRVERSNEQVQDLGLKLVDGRIHGRSVSARAVHGRWCHASAQEIAEYRVHKSARLYTPAPGGSEAAGLFLLVFSIYSLPISAAVSGVVIAASDDRHEQTVTQLPDQGTACDLPAEGVSVWLSISGGVLAHATTGPDGVARFELDRVLARGEALMGIDGLTPPSWQDRTASR